MKIIRYSIIILITLLLFLILEFFSYLFLKQHYKYHGMPAMEKFSLFHIKSNYYDPMQTSFFYNYRFQDNLAKIRKDFPQTSIKGLLDEYFIHNKIDHPISKDNQSYDIYLFGGSTIFFFNDYVSIGNNINHHLNKEKINCSNLHLIYPKGLRVISAGHSGYATINQINRLVTDIIPLKPEMVVFFDGINDFIMGHSLINYQENNTIHEKYYLKFFNKKNNFLHELANLPDRFYSLYLFNKFLKKSFQMSLYRNKNESTNYEKFNEILDAAEKDRYSLESLENYKNNHLILEALSEKFQFVDLHLLQPTLAMSIEELGLDKNLYHNKWPDPEGILKLKKEQKLKASKFWYKNTVLFWNDLRNFYQEKNHDKYIDISKLMNHLDMDKLYRDIIHYDDIYLRDILARAIAKEILKKLNCY